ncbi:ABC transporter permease [Embleya sp. NPDC001921]
MFKIAIAGLRARWATFMGAFTALALGVGVITLMAMTLASTFGTPFPGPQRFAAAPVVVTPTLEIPGQDDRPLTRPGGLSHEVVGRLAATGRTVVDRSFAVALVDGPTGKGHGWSSAALAPHRLVAGRAPMADHEVVVGGARELLNRRVRPAGVDGQETYTVVGVTAHRWFEQPVFFTDAEAARLSPRVDAVVAYADAGVVRRAVAGLPRVEVLTGAERVRAEPDPTGGRDALTAVRGMAATSTAAVVSVTLFVVVGTFSFVAGRRRRELALLRAIGVEAGQLRRMLLAEAALIGAAASLVGCLLGALVAAPVDDWLIDQGAVPEWFRIELAPLPLLVAWLTGIAAAVTGVAAVAVRVARVRPIEALREAVVETGAMTTSRWLIGLGLAVAGVGAASVITADSPLDAANLRKFVSVPFAFVGAFALLAPVLLAPLARLVTLPFARIPRSGLGPTLVRRNAAGAGRRTASTVAPVVVAIGLAAAALSAQATVGQAKDREARQRSTADFVVRPAGTGEIGARTVAAIRALPGVDVATFVPTRIYVADHTGRIVDTLAARAVEPSELSAVRRLPLVDGSLPRQDASDYVVVDEKTARSAEIAVGDELSGWLPDGARVPLRVSAVVRTALAGETTFISGRHAAGGLPDRVDVRVRQGADAVSVGAALRAAVTPGAAEVVSAAEDRARMRAEERRESRLATYTIVGIAFVYSCLAIANMLMMSATTRRKELASLRLVGASRRQILGYVAAETALVVLLGAIGAALATASVSAAQWFALEGAIGGVTVVLPWAPVLVVTAVCTAVAWGASLLAGHRALHGVRLTSSVD